ncbi:hypothetical protein ACFOSV_15875 [Algoriphagus namhaensis]|uniref:Uncharacterized protein n=1 Tax=Algoriphagus namhaensis TaxID=915353 RepID=A0ABV8AVI8_9BACT
MKKILSLILFLGLSVGVFAQGKDFILLKRGANQKSQIRYYPGEEITYLSKKLGYYVTDVITELDQDFIYLRENIITPADILEIDVRNKDPRNRTLRSLNTLFLGAGVLLISVETINSLYQENEFEIDSGVGLTSAILIGTGLALLPVRYKTFKHKGSNRIQIIQMRMD